MKINNIYKRFNINGNNYLFCSSDFEIFKIFSNQDAINTIKEIKKKKDEIGRAHV